MRIAALSLLALVTACAGMPDTRPINAPQTTMAPPAAELDFGIDGDAIALAFSGGGARAASFSLGVLQQLRDMKDPGGQPLINRVGLVTGVSGGSITAAWFGLHGPDGLNDMRAAILDKDWQSQLNTTWMSPQNWDRLLQGGLNGPDKLSNWLDKEVFAGARMRDMPNRPHIIINATDLYSGAPFAFAPPWFEAICSDLPSVRLADAVAASMSVPVAFRPVVVKSFAKDCPSPLPAWVNVTERDRSAPILLRETARSFRFYREPERMAYLHLTDGGVADNFGVSSLVTMRAASQKIYGPISAKDAVKLRRLTFFIVNAERAAEGDWALKEGGPDGPQLVETLLGIATNAPKRAAADAFANTLSRWQMDIINWRCALSTAEAVELGAGPDWNCRDVDIRLDMISFADLSDKRFADLGKAATAVSLPKDTIDNLIAGGREAMANNPEILKFTRN
jgi:NTE family protein